MPPSETLPRKFIKKILTALRHLHRLPRCGSSAPSKSEGEIRLNVPFPFRGKNTMGDHLFSCVPSIKGGRDGPEACRERYYRVKFYNKHSPLAESRPETLLTRALGEMRVMREERRVLEQADELEYWLIDECLPSEPMEVFVKLRNGRLVALPDLDEWEDVFAVSPFDPNVENYWQLLHSRGVNADFGETDQSELCAITRVMTLTRKQSLPFDDACRRELYARSLDFLRERIERLVNIDDHPALTPAERVGYVARSQEMFAKWRIPYERLSRIYGDTHPRNILLKGNKALLMDPQTDGAFPPYGEPAIDPGVLFADLYWYSRLENAPVFQKRAHVLLDEYERQTGDKNIRRAVASIALPYRMAQLLNPNYAGISAYNGDISKEGTRAFFEDMWQFIEAGTC